MISKYVTGPLRADIFRKMCAVYIITSFLFFLTFCPCSGYGVHVALRSSDWTQPPRLDQHKRFGVRVHKCPWPGHGGQLSGQLARANWRPQSMECQLNNRFILYIFTQVDHAKTLHYVGAGVAFPAGLLFVCLQCVLTYRIAETALDYWMAHVRVALSAGALISLVLSILT